MFSLAAGSPPKTTGVIYHFAERFLRQRRARYRPRRSSTRSSRLQVNSALSDSGPRRCPQIRLPANRAKRRIMIRDDAIASKLIPAYGAALAGTMMTSESVSAGFVRRCAQVAPARYPVTPLLTPPSQRARSFTAVSSRREGEYHELSTAKGFL